MRDLIHGWWLVGQTKTWWWRKRFSDNLLHYYLIPLWLISPQAGSSSSCLTPPWSSSSSSSSQDTEKLLVEKLPEATSVPLLSLRCKLFYVKKNEFSYSCHNTVNYLEKIVKIHRPWLLQDWFSSTWANSKTTPLNSGFVWPILTGDPHMNFVVVVAVVVVVVVVVAISIYIYISIETKTYSSSG